MMNARETEAALLSRCTSVAQEAHPTARDGKEANVFRLAAMVVVSRFPLASTRLMQASNRYFAQHPDEQLPPEVVVRNGWVLGMSRFRDRLNRQLS
jgi:hypothetical protein